MQTGNQVSAVDRKLLAGVAVVLALILIAFCYVVFLLLRSKRADLTAQPQPAPTKIPITTTAVPYVQFLPIIVKSAAQASAPAAQPVATSTLWRFLSIDNNDVGSFENTGNPNQKLTARCIDTKRPAPGKGELYVLDDSRILKPQSGSKKIQRFEVISR